MHVFWDEIRNEFWKHCNILCFRKPTPSPPAVVSSISSCQNVYQGSSSSTSCSGTNSNSSSAMCVQGSQACNKEAWPSLQPGLTTNSNTNGLYDINDILLWVFLNFCTYLNVRQLYSVFSELEKEWPSLILRWCVSMFVLNVLLFKVWQCFMMYCMWTSVLFCAISIGSDIDNKCVSRSVAMTFLCEVWLKTLRELGFSSGVASWSRMTLVDGIK